MNGEEDNIPIPSLVDQPQENQEAAGNGESTDQPNREDYGKTLYGCVSFVFSFFFLFFSPSLTINFDSARDDVGCVCG